MGACGQFIDVLHLVSTLPAGPVSQFKDTRLQFIDVFAQAVVFN